MKINKQNGFTLVELLVVVAIVALLVSILLPALAKAKDQVRTTVCATKQKNLMIAWTLYAEDHDGRIMPVWHGWGTPWFEPEGWWPLLIPPYISGITLDNWRVDWEALVRINMFCPVKDGPIAELDTDDPLPESVRETCVTGKKVIGKRLIELRGATYEQQATICNRKAEPVSGPCRLGHNEHRRMPTGAS